jgi:hypothetical protein
MSYRESEPLADPDASPGTPQENQPQVDLDHPLDPPEDTEHVDLDRPLDPPGGPEIEPAGYPDPLTRADAVRREVAPRRPDPGIEPASAASRWQTRGDSPNRHLRAVLRRLAWTAPFPYGRLGLTTER